MRAILLYYGCRSAFHTYCPKIATTHLVALLVLIGSWVKQVLCLSALVMLGLSCRLMMFLMGKRILSICVVFSLKSNFTPKPCIVCLPKLRSYIGAWSPRLYSTMSSSRRTFFLAEYSKKKVFNVTHLVCDKGAVVSATQLRDNLL